MKEILAFILAASCAFAGSAKLAWDANPPAEQVTGYIVYHATNLTAGFSVFAVAITNSLTVSPLRSGEHYFFVTALNNRGLESDPSNQVLAPVPFPPMGIKLVLEP